MKDAELRNIVLNEFYKNRRKSNRMWRGTEAPTGIASEDFFAMCQQLAEQGLISWTPHFRRDKGTKKIDLIVGQITAQGVDVIEGVKSSPISIAVDQRQIRVESSSYVQIGNANKIHKETAESAKS